MTWLLIAIIAAAVLFLFLKKKPAEEASQTGHQPEAGRTSVAQAPMDDELSAVIAAAIAEFEGSEVDDELLALMAAAIAEFEGDSEFRVVRVRPSGNLWAFTGRQQLMHSRL